MWKLWHLTEAISHEMVPSHVPPPSLLDTDMLSELFKGNPSVKIRASEYLRDRNRLTISLITKHEILKGLLAKKAQKQIDSFIAFCKANVAW